MLGTLGITSIWYANPVAALAVLAATSSRAVMFLGMAVLASGLNGFFNLWQVVLADTFGREHIGAIRGVVDAFNSTAIFVGPVLFGLLFDLSGSYRIAIWALVATSGLMVPLTLLMASPAALARRLSAAPSA